MSDSDGTTAADEVGRPGSQAQARHSGLDEVPGVANAHDHVCAICQNQACRARHITISAC